MKVYINDCSIEGQADTEVEAVDILWVLAKTVTESKNISYENKAFRTREMGFKEIVVGVSVKEVLVRASRSKRQSDKVKFVLEVLLKYPFSESLHVQDGDAVRTAEGNCLKNTCFDSASGSVSGALVVSAEKSGAFAAETVSLESSIFGPRVVLNAWSEDRVKQLSWVFDHNAKHRSDERVERGVIVSAMDLSGADAQKVLTNGIMVNERVYGQHCGKWYQFHRHEAGLYHGFKIDKLAENNPRHMKALKVFNSLDSKECGQVFDL
jgi:hypothetical protein